MSKVYYVYMLATKRNGTFYIGMTSDLARRIWEHRQSMADGFTKKYSIHRLVYFESHDDVEQAIRREKSIKRWSRKMKMHAVEKDNPDWEDLYHDLNM